LVNNLLNASRLELGTYKINTSGSNIISISKTVVREFQPLIKDKKILFKEHYTKTRLIAKADPTLMNIIMHNLISNALNYTPPAGKISVVITSKKGYVQIRVADSGCGIPNDQKDNIFSKLFRAENAKTVYPIGTGLGLYMVKSIIEKLNGKISFTSKENKGTVFKVVLPEISQGRK